MQRSSIWLKSGIKIFIGFAAFAGLLVILFYAVDKNFLEKSALAPTNSESAAGARAAPIVASPPIEPKPLIAKSNCPSITLDESYYSTFFKSREVKKEDAVKIKQILRTLGYGIKEANGAICNKTIACLKQYSLDFGYMPKDGFPGCFFKSSSFHYQIALEHHDWLDIYSTSDLENWILEQPDELRTQIQELPLDKPNTVVQVLRRYKFERFRPLPIPSPQTGIIRKNFSDAAGHLKIRTRSESKNYYIKLIDLTQNQEILSAFIRSGSTLSIHLPLGIYELRYAAGHNWYGSEYLFGTSTSYAKLPKLITFAEKEGWVGGSTIELIPSQYGKLTTEIISEYDF